MLLIIILISITIVSFVIVYLDEKFWDTEFLMALCGAIGIIGSVASIIAIGVLIIGLCIAPSSQAAYEERYNKLLYKVAHIDSFNQEEIIAEVDAWNEKYRENTYGKKSPWNGIFYTIDTSTTNLIELNGDKYNVNE